MLNTYLRVCLCPLADWQRDRQQPGLAAQIPQGQGGGAEPQAQGGDLHQRLEGPQQCPVPAAGQTLHTQGEVTPTRSRSALGPDRYCVGTDHVLNQYGGGD